MRVIPENAFLYKEGLYIVESVTVRGTPKWELYSAEGWCFYDLTQPENFDEEGNLVPEEKRIYAQYEIMRKDPNYVTNNIVCVIAKENYEIV